VHARSFLCLLVLAASVSSVNAAQDTLVLVANSGDSTVSVFAALKVNGTPFLRQLKVLPAGKGPSEICLSPDGTRAYVSNGAESSVTVLDLQSMSAAATFVDKSMKRPDGCVVSPDGSRLYTAVAGGDTISVFSTADGKKTGEIKVGKEPRRLLFSRDGRRLYVSVGDEEFVSIVDPAKNAPVGKIPAGRDPRALALTPDGKYLLISNVSSDTVELVKADTHEVECYLGVSRSPQRFAVFPQREMLFAIGRFDNVVSILDLQATKEIGRMIGTMPVGKGAWGMGINPDGSALYVANTTDNTITLIDLRLMRPSSFPTATGKTPMGLVVR
jgi:YVTN family beta-propeller protein